VPDVTAGTVFVSTRRQIQRAVLRWMAELLPPAAFWLHVPNQGPSPEFTRALMGDGLKRGARALPVKQSFRRPNPPAPAAAALAPPKTPSRWR
jgi:hypothetical protein